MDTLPQELISLIASFVERREGEAQTFRRRERKQLPANLPPLSVLSQSWKEANEAITFRTLDIKSTDLHDLRAILSGARRDRVRRISFTPVLPAYSDEDCGRHETVGDRIANNESFSRSLKGLFEILKVWEDDGVKKTIALHLYPPIDVSLESRVTVSMRREKSDALEGKRIDLFRRWERSYVRVIGFEQLPVLKQVSSMSVNRLGSRREYAPATVAQIASRLENLESVTWDLFEMDDSISDADEADSLDDIGTPESVDELDRSGRYTTSRRQTRKELAEALIANPLRSLKKAYIDLYHEVHAEDNAVHLCPDSPSDPFSAALHLLSQTLTTFHLEAIIDPSLFWPLSAHDAAPTWPSLRTYIVAFDKCTPAGNWYFTRNNAAPPSSPSPGSRSSLNHFRTLPNNEHIEPLLLSFARAAQQMPVLELATLTCPLEHEEYNKFRFGISYQAPGEPAYYVDEDEEDERLRRDYYDVGDWRPSGEVAGMMREIGKERWGGRCVERFLERLDDEGVPIK